MNQTECFASSEIRSQSKQIKNRDDITKLFEKRKFLRQLKSATNQNLKSYKFRPKSLLILQLLIEI